MRKPALAAYPPATAFELFFAECAMVAANDHRTPGEYVWDLKNPGPWADHFKAGLTPREAVDAVFDLPPLPHLH